MKKFTFTLLFVMGCFFSLQAQDQKRVGALLAYGSEIESLGIGLNAEFPAMENLTIAPSIIYYLPQKEFGISVNWLEVNANANYYFISDEKMSVYALGGINYSSISASTDGGLGMGSYKASEGRLGLNLGGGINIETGGNLIPFGELKYVLIQGGQLVIGAGIKYTL